ncbi:hypothetical protein [Mesorhizobium sp. M0870]|uniref:hypothetical protein n=1 Tax=Mesorhizobium sp. M0870 TaxID=2957016 RepID=UPI0033364F9E
MAGRNAPSQHNGPFRAQPVAPAGTETKITAAAMPTGGVGWTGWLSAIWYALAGVTAGSADAGGSIKAGGVYNVTPATLTTGQRADLQTDNLQNLKVVLSTNAGGGVALQAIATNADGVATSSSASTLATVSRGSKFNGTSYDRDRKPNGTKILPSAAASTNPDFAKASAGDLHCISGVNAAASVRYLKLFNKASAPTVGTDNPIMVIALPVGAFNINVNGHYFSTGIAFALTTGAALLDTGAVTAADVVGLTLTYA